MCLVSCSDTGRRVAKGTPYVLTGELYQDSLRTDSCMVLLIDRHEECLTDDGDTLPAFEEIIIPVAGGKFMYQGEVPYDVDELTLVDQHNNAAHIFAASGLQVGVTFAEDGSVEFADTDTINHWLAAKTRELDGARPDEIRKELDSICSTQSDNIRSTLLLREMMPSTGDSIFLRRTLGKLTDEAKPEWLLNDINDRFDIVSQKLGKNYRLPKAEVLLPDTSYMLQGSRPESLVLLFWADYDSTSVDSLKIFSQIARDFGLYDNAKTFATEKSPTRSKNARRIELMSVCLHAQDSAAWLAVVKDIPGKHAWIREGMAHQLPAGCRVSHLPSIYCFDRFGNYQCHDRWGTDIYEFLNRANINSQVSNKAKK